jgi:hypothetical protein
LPAAELCERLDADLFDRLSYLSVTVSPLRECREDLKGAWERARSELRQRADLPREPSWSSEIERVLLTRHALPGNLRDLQRVAVLVMAWWSAGDASKGIQRALREWKRCSGAPAQIKGDLGAAHVWCAFGRSAEDSRYGRRNSTGRGQLRRLGMGQASLPRDFGGSGMNFDTRFWYARYASPFERIAVSAARAPSSELSVA